MKIGKLTRWILVIGVVAVALIWLSGNIIRQRALQHELNEGVSISGEQLVFFTTEHQQTVTNYTARRDELEGILGKPLPPVSDFIAVFESPGRAIEFTECIYEDAYQTNVTILTIDTALPQEHECKNENESGDKVTLVTYETSSIQITAEGEVVALLNFLDKLSTRFYASYISQVTIKVPEGVYADADKDDEEDRTTASEPEKASITIDLEIYAYEDENG